MDSLILPSMHAAVHQRFLEELSQRHLHELLCLILDGAPGHKAGRGKLKVPDNIRLVFLPPYSPNHNRIERVWKDLHDEVTRNHKHPTIEGLMDAVWYYIRQRNRKETQNLAIDKAA